MAKGALYPRCRKAAFPFTDIAMKLGNKKCANMVALGCFCGLSRLVAIESIKKIIDKHTPAQRQDLAILNKKALEAGLELCLKERQ